MRTVIAALVVCLGLTAMQAQTYNFRNYSEEDGLPQSYIYGIAQSKNGFLNLATGEGFSVFDGSRFTNYTVQDGLAENFITTLFIDSKETTWLGHFQNGISCIKHSKIKKIQSKELDGLRVNQFLEDQRKNIWVASLGGVYRIDSTETLYPALVGEGPVNAITCDENNDLLCATNNGMVVLNVSGKTAIVTDRPEDFENKMVKFIIPGNYSHTIFWVAVDGEGVYGIRKIGKEYSAFIHIYPELQSTSCKISGIYKDRKGDLWIGLFGEGLCKVSFMRNDNYRYSVLKIGKENGLKNDYIQSIFEDYEGNMWFGTFGEGLIEKPIEKFTFFSSHNGLTHNNVRSVLIDRQNNLWLGNDAGLNFFKPQKQGQSMQYGNSGGFPGDQVNALLQDKAGHIWIGTNSSGAFVLDPTSGKFINFTEKHRLSAVAINCMTQDRDGNIIIGSDEGICLYDPAENSVKELTTMQGLLHNNVVHLFTDSKNRLWISSHGAPPYYYSNGQFKALKNIPNLRSFNINAVTEDRDHNIWIATEGDGVFKYDGISFTNYKTDEGLLSNYCYSVLTDKNNSVWITHKNGLSEKKKEQRYFRQYTRADALLFPENNLNASFRDHEGNVWFGTTAGLVHFNSESEKSYRAEPKLTITDIAFNKLHYKPGDRIVKSYGNYNVRINFIAVSLAKPEKVNYRYRLLGLDSTWHSTTNRSVEYPKLNDGQYTFQVEACNHEGLWTSAPTQLSFEIGLPVWKRFWFYLLLFLAVAVISYGVIHWRTSKLRQSKELLELKVKEKTFLLQQEKETVEKIKMELEEKNKDITDSINYAKRIQEALLPAQQSILEKLPDSFILYQPRDIVSGDFYWFHETEDCYIIAAIDCTGHGVPGAFMSLIGSTLLNEIVGNQIIQPSEILRHLNDKIIHVLHQERADGSTYDGMDMAICSITKQKGKCVFAGAPRPLYHIREGKLQELKGNSVSIGGHNTGVYKSFLDHEIEIQSGDMLYMFSDGYTDQFNPSLHKKFTTRRLKDLLSGISYLPGEAQCEKLKQEFRLWRGAEDQLDDVLVIGIRV